MTGRALYRAIKKRLEQADKPAFDAACLLEKHLHIKRGELPLRGEALVPEAVCTALWADVERRAAGEPLQYLLGEWEFMGLPFKVGPGVLIPRPETELLAETAISYLHPREPVAERTARLLELCAGSGCVTISVAQETGCEAVCLEFSTDALAFLRENIRLHRLEDRVCAVQGDMLRAPRDTLTGSFDVLLCNPPYIRTDELPTLQAEVCREPVLALDGGADGLRFYRALCAWISVLRPGGLLACEVGMGQAQDVAHLLTHAGLMDVEVQNDYAGIGRMVRGFRTLDI
ncbi:MAG: peptide chain release factor N(5)-glutamine methyltransferase [Ethanoligenens sp.]|uniref:peptide chain release factor N(5)-glutamine methyltransferase n=1 Tax=Ethanoligenens sp. TaxID=2099655 RepID=UPI0039E8396B